MFHRIFGKKDGAAATENITSSSNEDAGLAAATVAGAAAAAAATPSSAVPVELILERKEISLTLQSDGSASVEDSFSLPTSRAANSSSSSSILPQTTVPVNSLSMTCRPLSQRVNIDTFSIQNTPMPVTAYRVETPLWSLKRPEQFMTAYVGTHALVHYKDGGPRGLAGVIVHGDNEHVVLYNEEDKSMSVVRSDKLSSVTLHDTPPSSVGAFANVSTCRIELSQPLTLPIPLSSIASQLIYEMEPEALKYQIRHDLVVCLPSSVVSGAANEQPGSATMRFISTARVLNDTGINLHNCNIKLKERYQDRGQPRAVGVAQQKPTRSKRLAHADAGAGAGDEESAPRSYSQMGAADMAPSARAAVVQSDDSNQRAMNIVAQLNPQGNQLRYHLSANTTTNIIQQTNRAVPLTVRYDLVMRSAPLEGSASSRWETYENSECVLTFNRQVLAAPLLSGYCTVRQDSGGGGGGDGSPPQREPPTLLSDQPVWLDAWQNLSSGRVVIRPGNYSEIRWRSYYEQRRTDVQKNSTTFICRVDVALFTDQTVARALRLVVRSEQPNAEPQLLGIYRRLPPPPPLEKSQGTSPPIDESASSVTPYLMTGDTIQSNARWARMSSATEAFQAYDTELDDAPQNNYARQLHFSVQPNAQDTAAFAVWRYPLVVSIYYKITYV